ncbi:hypothetical protein HMPREF1531_01788 [Propionibacterium sp. oral taxon 192 str. F0372]|uniref:FUSC family protein n=1 Tax=Propionibacterium sp. oral taxon 192 TaxID=671222 RepID=UPI0003534F4D|nr:aromatic acid exporter family protein [Propionibacterium sp. oral taxon 192]EPH02480.1 hypothetical protein HMPREF1531_01788 [Propionibacterium sp. oral taxon 192 str. F0372]
MLIGGRWRHKLLKMWPGLPGSGAEFWRSTRDEMENVLRYSCATIVAFLVTRNLFHTGAIDLTGSLAALLISRASLRGSFRAGLIRVSAVGVGILLALVVATLFGLHWWSLGLVVFGGMMLARFLRLESQNLEVAISAMLILGAATSEIAAWQRFAATMAGTLIGIVVPLLIPRRVRVGDLASAVELVVLRLSEVCDSAAGYLSGNQLTNRAVDRWLGDTYQISPLIARATVALNEADDVRRLNTRQIYDADVVPLLRGHLANLEKAQLATRHLFLVMNSRIQHAPLGSEELARRLGKAFEELSSILAGYGWLVQADGLGDERTSDEQFRAILVSKEHMGQQLALLATSDDQELVVWWAGSGIAPAMEQVVAQLDLASHPARMEEWKSSQLGKVLPGGRIGPRIRSPWGLFVQKRLHDRARTLRQVYPEGVNEVSATDTTTLLPAIKEDGKGPAGEGE